MEKIHLYITAINLKSSYHSQEQKIVQKISTHPPNPFTIETDSHNGNKGFHFILLTQKKKKIVGEISKINITLTEWQYHLLLSVAKENLMYNDNSSPQFLRFKMNYLQNLRISEKNLDPSLTKRRRSGSELIAKRTVDMSLILSEITIELLRCDPKKYTIGLRSNQIVGLVDDAAYRNVRDPWAGVAYIPLRVSTQREYCSQSIPRQSLFER